MALLDFPMAVAVGGLRWRVIIAACGGEKPTIQLDLLNVLNFIDYKSLKLK